MGWWHLRLSTKILALLRLSVNFFQLRLKEQYPVSAHATNFDFWTGCREIKTVRRVREP